MSYERRANPRVKCPVSFQVMIEEYPDAFGRLANLSIGGITFVFPEKLHHRSILNFVITCPITPFNLDIHAEVVWSKNLSGKNNYISGAVFPYLSEDEVSYLRKVISLFSSEIEKDRRKEERRKLLEGISKDRRKDDRRKKSRH